MAWLFGRLTGKREVIEIDFSALGGLEPYGEPGETGIWEHIRTGYNTRAHLRVRTDDGAVAQLELIHPADRPWRILDQFKTPKAL